MRGVAAGLIAVLLAGMAMWSQRMHTPGLTLQTADEGHAPLSQLGLVTSLPIYWTESPAFELALDQGEPGHWARVFLEKTYHLVLLDRLSGAGGEGMPDTVLEALDILLLAQPRAMPPADMVALDRWVRDGGQVLIFADPMLTGHSAFALGDPRRPQAIATLDPLMARWGLDLGYDSTQPAGERYATLRLRGGAREVTLPVNQAGQLVMRGGFPTEQERCSVSAAGLMAHCRIGSGRAVIIADAALLEESERHAVDQSDAGPFEIEEALGENTMRQEAFSALLNASFVSNK